MIFGLKPVLGVLFASAGLLLVGCGSTPGEGAGTSQVGSRSRAELMEGDVFAASAAESERTDFGLTVLTNKGVRLGGPIKWIVIGEVAPRSHAEMIGLTRGDEIMAVDGVLLAELSRDVMLRQLFGRQPGDRIRLLVYQPAITLPHFVDLLAGRQK